MRFKSLSFLLSVRATSLFLIQHSSYNFSANKITVMLIAKKSESWQGNSQRRREHYQIGT